MRFCSIFSLSCRRLIRAAINRTHVKPEIRGQAGRWQSEYHDVMIEHDQIVGKLLKKLDDLGIADNTIVLYTTDNGAEEFSWPDGGTTPFRSEKNANW